MLKGMKVTQRVNLAHTSGGIHKSNGPEKYRLLICHLLRRQKKGKVNCLLHKKCNNPKLINPSFPLPTTYATIVQHLGSFLCILGSFLCTFCLRYLPLYLFVYHLPWRFISAHLLCKLRSSLKEKLTPCINDSECNTNFL